MGYYTKYTLQVQPQSMDLYVRKALEKKAYDGSSPFVEGPIRWNGGIGCKWYSHKGDCTKVSIQFPDATIIITAAGEDESDVWRQTYISGSCNEERDLPRDLVEDFLDDRELEPPEGRAASVDEESEHLEKIKDIFLKDIGVIECPVVQFP